MAEKDQNIWNVYVARSLQLVNENIAKRLGGSMMEKSFVDFLRADDPSHDDRSAEEIVADVIKKAGLEAI